VKLAVLAEAISVVIRCDRLLAVFGNDWNAFKAIVPNQTLCADNELVRVGFMSPTDVEGFVDALRGRGLTYLVDGVAKDLVIVDQLRGPLARCDWIGFGHISSDGDPNKKVASCRTDGSTQSVVVMPEGWRFDQSLSASFGFVPNEHIDKSLNSLRHEGGLDVYENELTGREVFIGRTGQKTGR
jgi:hypothetical protein